MFSVVIANPNEMEAIYIEKPIDAEAVYNAISTSSSVVQIEVTKNILKFPEKISTNF